MAGAEQLADPALEPEPFALPDPPLPPEPLAVPDPPVLPEPPFPLPLLLEPLLVELPDPLEVAPAPELAVGLAHPAPAAIMASAHAQTNRAGRRRSPGRVEVKADLIRGLPAAPALANVLS